MTTTSAEAVYAQAADYIGADPDETRTLTRDWNTARRTHPGRLAPGWWQRARKPFNRTLEARHAQTTRSAA